MIGYIKGQVAEIGDGYVILDNGGIGYRIFVSSFTLAKATPNQFMQIYTYLNVKEDGMFLYGFSDKEEKNMFMKLITISGVGPKAALSVLSGIELNKLMVAIINQDIKTISSIKGIGKKTAERIILELKENIDSLTSDAVYNFTPESNINEPSQDVQDAIYALRGLGFTQQEAERAVKKALPHAKDLQELISLSLRNLN